MGVGTIAASLHLAAKENELRQARQELRAVTPRAFPELRAFINDGEITTSELRSARMLARELENGGDYDSADAVNLFIEQAKNYRGTKVERDRAIVTLGAAYVAEREGRWADDFRAPAYDHYYDRYSHHRGDYERRYFEPPRYGRNYEAEAWARSQVYHPAGYSNRFRAEERQARAERQHFDNRDLSKTNDWRGNPIAATPTTAEGDRVRRHPDPRRDRSY